MRTFLLDRIRLANELIVGGPRVEYAISKSDLRLRPVFHQKTERVEGHILVCFLRCSTWDRFSMLPNHRPVRRLVSLF